MMNIQNIVAALSLTMLALVAVSCKDILADIPKSHLFAMLVLHTLNCIILYLLSIELSNLDGCFGYRKNPVYHTDNFQVTLNLITNTRCKPSFFSASIVKSRLAITSLAVTPCATQLRAACEFLHDVRPKNVLCSKQFPLLRGCRNSNMYTACINA